MIDTKGYFEHDSSIENQQEFFIKQSRLEMNKIEILNHYFITYFILKNVIDWKPLFGELYVIEQLCLLLMVLLFKLTLKF